MPLSIDLYLPALPTIALDLKVSPGAAQFTLAVFLIGVAIGQVAYGPITDKYGRKKPLLFGLAVYSLGAMVCALAPTINLLIGGRFLQALGASASAVITATSARDLWSGKTLAVTRLPETSSPHERAAARLRDAARTYATLRRNPPFMRYVLTGACLAGCLLAFITGSSFMYIEGLGVSPTLFAVLFSLTAMGFVVATQLNRLLLRLSQPGGAGVRPCARTDGQGRGPARHGTVRLRWHCRGAGRRLANDATLPVIGIMTGSVAS